MVQEQFVVKFTSGLSICVRAFNKREARILAQAEMINLGNSFDIESVREDVRTAAGRLPSLVCWF